MNNQFIRKGLLGVCLGSTLILAGCAGREGPAATTIVSTSGSVREMAGAELHPTQGNEVKGKVTFIKEAAGIRIAGEITGLTPGKHGFHIHEKGDCSAPDGTSAGGHFNPTSAPHGAPGTGLRHAGDFGNIEADAHGIARFDRVDSLIAFEGPNSIIGRAVIVHADPDDLTTQPTGNAGKRVACGVILRLQ